VSTKVKLLRRSIAKGPGWTLLLRRVLLGNFCINVWNIEVTLLRRSVVIGARFCEEEILGKSSETKKLVLFVAATAFLVSDLSPPW